MEEQAKVRSYFENGIVKLDVTENGETHQVETDLTDKEGKVTVQASACEVAINALCGVGGVVACNAACRSIPVIGILLGFTVCRNLCAQIAGSGCKKAKEKFC